jgi:hypothetical protein
MFRSSALLRALALLVIGAFFSAAALSLFLGMTMQTGGFLSPCPLMDDDGAFCPITLAAHLAPWQELSKAQPTRGMLGVALLSFAFLLIPAARRTLAPLALLFRRFRKRFLALRARTPLSMAFSQGIIHSRLFA